MSFSAILSRPQTFFCQPACAELEGYAKSDICLIFGSIPGINLGADSLAPPPPRGLAIDGPLCSCAGVGLSGSWGGAPVVGGYRRRGQRGASDSRLPGADSGGRSGRSESVSLLSVCVQSAISQPSVSVQSAASLCSVCHPSAFSLPPVCVQSAVSLPSVSAQSAASLRSVSVQSAASQPLVCRIQPSVASDSVSVH